MDEEQRPPAIGTYDTDPFLTDAQKRAEEERAEKDSEQDDADTDDGE